MKFSLEKAIFVSFWNLKVDLRSCWTNLTEYLSEQALKRAISRENPEK